MQNWESRPLIHMGPPNYLIQTRSLEPIRSCLTVPHFPSLNWCLKLPFIQHLLLTSPHLCMWAHPLCSPHYSPGEWMPLTSSYRGEKSPGRRRPAQTHALLCGKTTVSHGCACLGKRSFLCHTSTFRDMQKTDSTARVQCGVHLLCHRISPPQTGRGKTLNTRAVISRGEPPPTPHQTDGPGL